SNATASAIATSSPGGRIRTARWSAPSRGRRRVLGPPQLHELRGRCRRVARLGARVQRGAVLDGAPGQNTGGETRGRARGRGLMLSGPRAAIDPDRLTGEGRRASRTRFKDGGGYLRIPRFDHFSTVTQRTHVPHRPSPYRGPILDDGEHVTSALRGQRI